MPLKSDFIVIASMHHKMKQWVLLVQEMNSKILNQDSKMP